MVIAGDRIEGRSPPFSTISIRYSIVEDEDGVMENNEISMQNVLQ